MVKEILTYFFQWGNNAQAMSNTNSTVLYLVNCRLEIKKASFDKAIIVLTKTGNIYWET